MGKVALPIGGVKYFHTYNVDPILKTDNAHYLKVGFVLVGEQDEYPEAFRQLGSNDLLTYGSEYLRPLASDLNDIVSSTDYADPNNYAPVKWARYLNGNLVIATLNSVWGASTTDSSFRLYGKNTDGAFTRLYVSTIGNNYPPVSVTVLKKRGWLISTGTYGASMLSKNEGETWASITDSYGFCGVHEVGEELYGYNNNGIRFSSTDGVTWTNRASIFSGVSNVYAVCYAGGKFFAVTNSGLLTSIDGITFTGPYISTGLSSYSHKSDMLVHGHAGYLLLGANGLAVSSDGSSWTTVPGYNSIPFSAAVYVDGTYIVVGSDSRILTSTDLLSWNTIQGGGGVLTTYNHVSANSNGMVLISGQNGEILTLSKNAVPFLNYPSPSSGEFTPYMRIK